jgi:hypothetical protein
MYIQITSKCNMTCKHCCFSATKKGHDMDEAVFKWALNLAESRGDQVVLGGGEPTLHPQFLDYLWLAMRRLISVSRDLGAPAVSVITNGSQTSIALELANMAAEGYIAADVSRDEWHAPIDRAVYAAFDRPKRDPWYSSSGERAQNRDYRAIRTVTHILPVGRAKRNGLGSDRPACVCEEAFVDPKGVVWECGCKEHELGRFGGAVYWPEESDVCTHERRRNEGQYYHKAA